MELLVALLNVCLTLEVCILQVILELFILAFTPRYSLIDSLIAFKMGAWVILPNIYNLI